MEKEDAQRKANGFRKQEVAAGRDGKEVEGAAAIRELRVARSTSRT